MVHYYSNNRSHDVITGDSRAASARLLLEVAHQPPVQAPASDHCWRQPAVPAAPQPADDDGASRSSHGSLKHASKPGGASKTNSGVEARSAR